MVRLRLSELSGSGRDIPVQGVGNVHLDALASVDVQLSNKAAFDELTTDIRPLVTAGVLGWVLLPGSEGY